MRSLFLFLVHDLLFRFGVAMMIVVGAMGAFKVAVDAGQGWLFVVIFPLTAVAMVAWLIRVKPRS